MSFEILGKAYLYANVTVGQIVFFKPYQMFFFYSCGNLLFILGVDSVWGPVLINVKLDVEL